MAQDLGDGRILGSSMLVSQDGLVRGIIKRHHKAEHLGGSNSSEVEEEAEGAFSLAVWTVGMLSATLVKIVCSIDDVVWLAPFLAGRSRRDVMIHSAIYVWVCFIQALIALGLSHGGTELLDTLLGSKSNWSTEKVLTVTSGLMLFMYGAYLASFDCKCKAKTESPEDTDNDGDFKRQFGDLEGADTEVSQLLPGGDSNSDKSKSFTARSLIVIAFIGSLDDLTLFVPLLVGKAIGWMQLILGAGLATCMIILVCLSLTCCTTVTSFLSRLPLWGIVFTFSTYLLIRGFFFEG